MRITLQRVCGLGDTLRDLSFVEIHLLILWQIAFELLKALAYLSTHLFASHWGYE